MEDLDGRIGRFVHSIVSTWLLIALISIVWFVFNYPLWWLLVLIPGLAVGFVLTVLVGGFIFGLIVEKEEVPYFDLVHEVELVSSSEEVIGKYQGNDIHEWHDAKINGEVRRYYYTDIAVQTDGGAYILPMEDGIFLINGMLYRHQPENDAETSTQE